MINVKIDEDTLLNMLCERVDAWRSGEEAELFYKMYEDYIYGGVFEGAEIDVLNIVDNDVINWCDILQAEDLSESDVEKLKEAIKNGDRDVSCESFNYGKISFIEAYNDEQTMFLIRY